MIAPTRWTEELASLIPDAQTIVIPGGTLGPSGRMKLTMLWRFVGVAGVKTQRVRLTNLAGTSLVSAASAANSLSGIIELNWWNLTAASQALMDGGNVGHGYSSVDVVNLAVNTANDFTIVITAQNAAAADTSTLVAYDLELCDTPFA